MAVNKSDCQQTGPPSIRQKQILDIAAAKPNVPMEDLADEIPSATTELVERVLEEYGDPAENGPETSYEEDDPSPAQETFPPELNDLSPKQRETLQAIAEQPTATQQKLADTLDVSGPTVCNRVNSIAGFNWEDRETFVEAVFENERTLKAEEAPPMASNGTESSVGTDELTERVTAIEQQLSTLTTAEADELDGAFAGVELTHKVAHACLTSDAITEDEELQILKVLLR